ncbi:hypothetical protein EDB80DRAFT_737887 [Ilyonectria destructans]|nr:hypothetical protein EDB80DRAFT_737887 [Ilyonectria destructans]
MCLNTDGSYVLFDNPQPLYQQPFWNLSQTNLGMDPPEKKVYTMALAVEWLFASSLLTSSVWLVLALVFRPHVLTWLVLCLSFTICLTAAVLVLLAGQSIRGTSAPASWNVSYGTSLYAILSVLAFLLAYGTRRALMTHLLRRRPQEGIKARDRYHGTIKPVQLVHQTELPSFSAKFVGFNHRTVV